MVGFASAARLGEPHVPGRRHQLHHLERRTAARGEAYLGSTLVLCATLFASAIFHRRFATLINRRAFRFLGPSLTTVGTLAIALRDAARNIRECDQAMRAGLDLDRSPDPELIDLGYGELYRSDRSSSHFVRSAARLPLIAAASSPAVTRCCRLLEHA